MRHRCTDAFESSFSLIDIRINTYTTLKLLRPFPYMTVYSILLLIRISWGDLLCTCLMIILWYLSFYKTGSVVVPYSCWIGRRSVSGTSNFPLLIQFHHILDKQSLSNVIIPLWKSSSFTHMYTNESDTKTATFAINCRLLQSIIITDKSLDLWSRQ